MNDAIIKQNILAADIGGTNSRFAHFQIDQNGSLELMDVKWLATNKADSFGQLLEQLRLSDAPFLVEEADIAVIAVAGPVEHGAYSAPPYISWDIDLTRAESKKVFRQAYLVNDFVAQAYASASDVGKSARVILAGKKVADGTIGVIGAGTALGMSVLVSIPGYGFLALPSEGGHTYFPFISQREIAFQEFYQEKSGQKHITGNLVVSGRGLKYIHWFLTGEELEPQQVAARFTPESETLAWAAKFYGRVCRDFALEALALGGLYIAGGVAARNPDILTHANFRDEFLDSPTMGHLLAEIPVFLIDNQDSGLWGAAFYGRQILQKS
ncbi:glucokinase [Desulfopila sp. IMCC35006]|uniref:glucokinase n=1 Tax=Desulfopila sp. IMCC35006 TaxID=2569542 RepID=UPI0010ABD9AE|nr:glucokinase [Desulfopila sp. IMCC35006]TKB26191.1 glucokinase [Desulfopila sp. IMCC35006]